MLSSGAGVLLVGSTLLSGPPTVRKRERSQSQHGQGGPCWRDPINSLTIFSTHHSSVSKRFNTRFLSKLKQYLFFIKNLKQTGRGINLINCILL